MRKMFAVIDIAHLQQLGMAVFRNDLGYDGHAVIRPAASMPAALYGTQFLRIPSFMIEIENKKGCSAIVVVTTEKVEVIHAAPFTGIKSEWTWEEEDTHAENIAEDSLHDSIGI
jgi:hypothetical protein